jgi:hypothetical protein
VNGELDALAAQASIVVRVNLPPGTIRQALDHRAPMPAVALNPGRVVAHDIVASVTLTREP